MYEEIIKAKSTFNNEVLKLIKGTIEETSKEAESKKLGPIQTFMLVMKKVNESLNNIKVECGMEPNEELGEDLMNQIYEMTDPYEQKMEEGLRLFVSRSDNIDTLGELLEHNRELEKIVSDISEYLYYPGDIKIRK